jgi:hypothetical protein
MKTSSRPERLDGVLPESARHPSFGEAFPLTALRYSMHVYTRNKAALRLSVMQPGERKSVWDLVQSVRRSNVQSRDRMMPDLWATRQAEIVRGMEMER